MAEPDLTLFLADEAATDAMAQTLAPHLGAGDVLLLQGPIGAGKTHFCRALIRARLGRAEEVPSPTFTLVQTYQAEPEIWHADLYRLTHPDEAWELGLDQAFETAICLVEWPDRLGKSAPPDAIRLEFAPSGPGRLVTLSARNRPSLAHALRQAMPDRIRAAAGEQLLAQAGWQSAQRLPLAGDASARRYVRLVQAGESRILMDSPPGIADDVTAFARIAAHLSDIGLSAPRILAKDLSQGFLLLEDLGDGVLARILDRDPAREAPLYRLATDVLLHLQSRPAPTGLPDLGAQDWAEAALLAVTHYAQAATGHSADPEPLRKALTRALQSHADGPRVLILRDYHAENLMLLPDRPGLRQLGLLDFQLAQMGQPGYDLVSLLQDARRDVSPATQTAMIDHFARARGLSAPDFALTCAVLGSQRALRILGIFARLCLSEGKPHYLRLIPRVWGQLQGNLSHPALAELRQACAALLPEPSPQVLNRIESQCQISR